MTPPNAGADPTSFVPPDAQRESLRALVELVKVATAAETDLDARHAGAIAKAKRDHDRAAVAAKQQAAEAGGKLDADHQSRRESIHSGHRADMEQVQADHEKALRTIHLRHDPVAHNHRQQFDEAKWMAETVLEAAQNRLREEHRAVQEEVAGLTGELDERQKSVAALMFRYGQNPDTVPAAGEPAPIAPESAQVAFDAHRQAVEMNLNRLAGLSLPGLFVGIWPAVIALFVLLLAALIGQVSKAGIPSADFVPRWPAIGIGLGIAAVLLTGAGIALKMMADQQVRRAYGPLRLALEESRRALQSRLTGAAKRREQGLAEAQEKARSEIRAAKDRFGPQVVQAKDAHETAVREENAAFKKRQADGIAKRDGDLDAAQGEHVAAKAESDRKLMAELAGLDGARDAATGAADGARDAAVAELQSRWTHGLVDIQTPFAAQSDGAGAAGFDPERWTASTIFPETLRFGQLQVDLAQITDTLPKRLTLPESFTVPSTLAFARRGSLLIDTDRASHDAAIDALRMVMTRILASLPPGRAKFTLIDPVALGQNFAGFMHLADHDESLVGGRIWTEADPIEQQLANLTEHMETVIQKYLRNEFATIDQYNAQAGELAEPYRFLVIADFPHAFEGDAYRRLASIASSGARCGVHTLIVRDLRLPLPSGVHLDELHSHSVHLVARDGVFTWKDEVFERFPLRVDAAPDEPTLTALMRKIGDAARHAKRVEVPFETIAPTPEEFWTADATHEIRVPIGRSGATRQQSLRLGRGVAQHALIAGKTGSGKSTLLHALVTNAAMWYSPDEVELYLVDFKKGVEFKTYATHHLPHARAIAVESDREFGLSVLQRIDGELTRRGDLFRRLGVQDLAGYRAAAKQLAKQSAKAPPTSAGGGASNPLPILPRTLLIVDEFQEFFSEDDKLSQDAGLLLDRLVRQGRAFGIHVLLGSQTIGGTGGLARTTIGQMAVRIALQTSEADSQLILGDNNSAARLLSRPGEAIYNDAGGLVESNSPFQVAWLPDRQRDGFLDAISAKALAGEAAGHPKPAEPPAIFEGNAPADPLQNRPLEALLAAKAPAAPPTAPLGWIGEPVAIKPPTAVVFRRQSGANVLVVGQDEEQAMAVMSSSLISLSAQHPAGAATFWIFDGSPADSPLAGRFARLADALPQTFHWVDYRGVAEAMTALATELAARQSADPAPAANHFIVIFSMQRYRALRKQEESFSFSSTDEPAAAQPDKQFAELLREGPSLGMHTLAWADTAASVERTLDRAAVREFDHRVLFQMSAADSSTLIDSPAANKLGFHRALAYSEEQGVVERFRPYALPTEEYLTHVRGGEGISLAHS